MTTTPHLDLGLDPVTLTAALVDIPSESHHEKVLADAVESALRTCAHLTVDRHGDTVVARTMLDRGERVLLGGHLDTVPRHGNLPHRFEGDQLFGLGSCDMKSGVAVALVLAASLTEPVRDVTYVFYDCEEVESRFNGLQRLVESHSRLLEADLAILMEPSNAVIEAGCQGTIRIEVVTRGERAHSARSWLGVNAIHAAGEVLDRLAAYEPRRPMIDGLEYREGLSAVAIRGGVAGNVIPDQCVVTVNYRFAPDRSVIDAIDHVTEVFDGFEVSVVDQAPGALPGLGWPSAAAFAEAVGEPARPKFGWTDVARFSALGIPALNFGPGDPSVAHTQGEHVPVAQILACESLLRDWLTAS
ncbi:MAG: succinyl-diaminopimelate desuccinylase [Actinomycetes bacterium]